MNYFSTKYKINDVFSDFHSKKGFILRRMQLAGNVSYKKRRAGDKHYCFGLLLS